MSTSVDLLLTLDLCHALKTYLAALPHPSAIGEKLFEVVAFHEDKDLGEAMEELIILKTRVCLIVPAGDRFDNFKEGRTMRSARITSIDLVMADRSYTKGGQDAAFGGPKNIGVVAMKEVVTLHLAQKPQLTGLRWCALYPTDGAFLTIGAAEAAKLPGRQAFVLNYETPSGWISAPLTSPWPV